MRRPGDALRRVALAPALANVVALLTFGAIAIRAARTADLYWDTLAYHWPFAARIAGLCDRHCFSLPPVMEARYDGFPLLLHAAQGALWRLTGSPAQGDLVNIALLAALCGYLRWRFAVPLAWSWLGFIAIPEVQIQLTSSYIDVPANAAITLAILAALRMHLAPRDDHRIDAAVAMIGLAIAAQGKFQLVPVALALWAVLLALVVHEPARLCLSRRPVAALAVLAIGAALLLPKLAINLATFANPFYPVAWQIGPLALPGTEPALSTNSVSDAWRSWPGPARWLLSVLEFDAFAGRPLPWTLGQGDVAQHSPAFRMGGYFVAYVLALVGLVAACARRLPRGGVVAGLVLAMSLACSLLPAAHELRYYLFWMLALVALALALTYSPLFAGDEQPALRRVGHAVVAVALASVVAMTGGDYLKTGGPTLSELLRKPATVVSTMADGATVCLPRNDRFAYLHARVFHPGRDYGIRVLDEGERAADAACTPLPAPRLEVSDSRQR